MLMRVLRLRAPDCDQVPPSLPLPAPQRAVRVSCPEEPAMRMEERQVQGMPADLPGEPGEPGLPGVQAGT